MSLDDLEKAVKDIRTTQIVTCPMSPAIVVSSSSAGAYTAGDAMGNLVRVKVPKRGIIVSATLFDLDDEGTQVDLEIFNRLVVQIASEDPWAPSDVDIVKLVTELAFFAFDDHVNCQTSEIRNIGKAYVASEGILYIQAVTRSTPTIAAGSEPRFQLQIQSFDLDFVES